MLPANRLITIPISHYCEKARWGLEWAGIPYVEERHLQVFHYWATFRAARTDSTPVLVTPDCVLTDSTEILRWCDTQSDHDRLLYPSDPALQGEVARFEDDLDESFGVASRLWMYTHLLERLPLIIKYSKEHGVPTYQMKLMPILFPLLGGRVKQVLEYKETSEQECRSVVDLFFSKVEKQLSDGRRFLFGDRFTAADLTFAALASPVLIPDNYGVCLPTIDELPDTMKKQILVWRARPAGQFALKLYREHRNR